MRDGDKSVMDKEASAKKSKKTLFVGITIMVIGLLVGGAMIVTALRNKARIDDQFSEKNQQARIQAMREEILELEEEIKAKQDRIKELKREDFNGFDDAYYDRADEIDAINNEIMSLQLKMYDIEGSKFMLENENHDLQKVQTYSRHIPLIYFGVFISLVSLIAGGIVILIAYIIKTAAFQVQAVIPFARESIKEMASGFGSIVSEGQEAFSSAKAKGGKKCTYCGGNLKWNEDFCSTCGARAD